MDWYVARTIWISVVAVCAMITISIIAAATTSGPMATRIACFPYVHTCTTTPKGYGYNEGNVTCRCEALPEDR